MDYKGESISEDLFDRLDIFMVHLFVFYETFY